MKENLICFANVVDNMKQFEVGFGENFRESMDRNIDGKLVEPTYFLPEGQSDPFRDFEWHFPYGGRNALGEFLEDAVNIPWRKRRSVSLEAPQYQHFSLTRSRSPSPSPSPIGPPVVGIKKKIPNSEYAVALAVALTFLFLAHGLRP